MGGVWKIFFPLRATRGNSRGVTLVEILFGIVIVLVVSIATLSYFAYAKGNVGIQGNRRAALERARERLEELMAAPVNQIKPIVNGALPQNNQPQYWVSCAGGVCTGPTANYVPEVIPVNYLLQAQRIESTIRWKDDPSVNTTIPDVLELSVKVWFTGNTAADDNYNRVHVRTLRTP